MARLEGEVDKLAVEQARSHLDPLAAAGKLVIDLDRVSFIDSAGLHALFGLGRVATAAGGGLALSVPSSCAVARVVEIVRLADAMPVRESVEDAAAAPALRGFADRRRRVAPVDETKGVDMPPRGVKKGSKRARQYEHIKDSLEGPRSEARGGDRGAHREQGAGATRRVERRRRGSRARTSRPGRGAATGRTARHREAGRRTSCTRRQGAAG